MQLQAVADVQMGYPFRARLDHEPEGELVVVQMKDIAESAGLSLGGVIRINLPSVQASHLLRPGDLLFRSRGKGNSAALVPESVPRAILAAPLLRIRPRGVLPEFLKWLINSPDIQRSLEALAEGTSVRMISAEALRNLDLPIPDTSTQQRIVAFAALADQEQSLMSRVAARRRQLTDHHLQHLLRKASP